MVSRLSVEASRACALVALCAATSACEPPTPARDGGDASADTVVSDSVSDDRTSAPDTSTSADSGVEMDAVVSLPDASADTMDAASSDGTIADVTSDGAADVSGDRAADVSSDGACASPPTPEAPVGGACRTNWLLCGGTCVDRLSDDNNCGACGNRCAAGSFCYIGLCFCSCTPPLICCSDSCSRTRTCADTQTDARHCGGCYRRCAAGQSCVAGACR